MREETSVVHSGLHPERHQGAVKPPVFHASTILSETVESSAAGARTGFWNNRALITGASVRRRPKHSRKRSPHWKVGTARSSTLGARRLRRGLARLPVRRRSPGHERPPYTADAQLRERISQTLWREHDVLRSARGALHRVPRPARNPGDLSRIARLAHFRSAGRPGDR